MRKNRILIIGACIVAVALFIVSSVSSVTATDFNQRLGSGSSDDEVKSDGDLKIDSDDLMIPPIAPPRLLDLR